MNAASPDAIAMLFERDRPALLRMVDDVMHLRRRGSNQSACKVFGELRRLIEHLLSAEQGMLDQLDQEGRCPPALAVRAARSHVDLLTRVEDAWQAVSTSGNGFEPPLDALRRGISLHGLNDRRPGRHDDPREADPPQP